jgi:hypothetical protein
VTLCLHIVFRARSSLKGIQTIYMGFFFKRVGIAFRVVFHLHLQYLNLYLLLLTGSWGSLQYLHLYLPLQTGILGHDCNTCNYTYLYQLGFWGLVTIPASNTNIIIILVFLHFTLFVLITWKQ